MRWHFLKISFLNQVRSFWALVYGNNPKKDTWQWLTIKTTARYDRGIGPCPPLKWVVAAAPVTGNDVIRRLHVLRRFVNSPFYDIIRHCFTSKFLFLFRNVLDLIVFRIFFGMKHCMIVQYCKIPHGILVIFCYDVFSKQEVFLSDCSSNLSYFESVKESWVIWFNFILRWLQSLWSFEDDQILYIAIWKVFILQVKVEQMDKSVESPLTLAEQSITISWQTSIWGYNSGVSANLLGMRWSEYTVFILNKKVNKISFSIQIIVTVQKQYLPERRWISLQSVSVRRPSVCSGTRRRSSIVTVTSCCMKSCITTATTRPTTTRQTRPKEHL